MTKEQAMWEVNRFNSKIGNLNEQDGIDCPICKNKAYLLECFENDLNRDGEIEYDIKGKWCSCKSSRESKLRQLRSGMGEYLSKRSKDYIVTEDWQKKCKDLMMQYCSNDIDNDKWFLACGQSGCGKTLLVSIIANYLLNTYAKEVRYVTWTDFISKLKRDMMGDQTNRVSDYFEELKNCEVLFIDEFLKIYNQTDLKYAVEIINYRYSNNLKTLITSEKTFQELIDVDEATAGRIKEKCKEYVINVPKDKNKNYRLKL